MIPTTERLETDVLIIGSGIAGGTAALQLATAGVPVTVVTRAREPHDSNTYWAQGGIVYRAEDDSPQRLADDIIQAGAGHSNPEAVHILAEQGPRLVEELLVEKIGVPFDREEDGRLATIREAAHTADHPCGRRDRQSD